MDRIDSFEAGQTTGFGSLLACRERHVSAALDCFHDTDSAGRERVELFDMDGRWSEVLRLTRMPNGFGGARAFWLCPRCGSRVRYLYFKRRGFVCRKCARLNYRSQQGTKSSSVYYYTKGMALAQSRLRPLDGDTPDGLAFCGYLPERPRYMHQSTYRRYLRRFLRYRGRHNERFAAEMARLVRRFR